MNTLTEFITLHTAEDASPWQEWLRLTENQLRHIFEPELGLFLAESPNVIERALDAGFAPYCFLIDDMKLTEQVYGILARCGDIPVYIANTAVISALSGYRMTRSVVCAMLRKEPADYAPILRESKRIAVLENVVNPTNVGAVFRSAAALGFDAVLLTQGSCDPLYRRAVRVSMGTILQIPWAYLPDAPNAAEGVSLLKQAGFLTAAMALRKDSLPPDDPRFPSADRLAVVLGTEGEGLDAETIAACDETVCIPMYHGVDSLNVAAASAVAFWAMRRKGDADA